MGMENGEEEERERKNLVERRRRMTVNPQVPTVHDLSFEERELMTGYWLTI